jgi:hypothetical protein
VLRSPVVLAVALVVCACRSAPRPSDEKTTKESVVAAAPPDAGRPARAAAEIDAGTGETAIPIAEYRAALLRDLMRLTKTREATVAPAEVIRADDAEIPHSIEVLKKIGQADAYIAATAGFGRLAHGPRKKSHVELLAYVDQYGGKIGQVLEALGEAMHAKGENGAEWKDWKEYDTVQLPQPQFGLQWFDLRPAGEVDVSPELRVILLKVIPMSQDEFERAKNNPAGEWDDPNANARSIQRWRRVLER